jgi:hypothetical protein
VKETGFPFIDNALVLFALTDKQTDGQMDKLMVQYLDGKGGLTERQTEPKNQRIDNWTERHKNEETDIQ